MPARYINIDSTQYSRGAFESKWTDLIKSYEVGISLSGSDFRFFLESAKHIPRFASVISKGNSVIKVVRKTFNGKKVKGIVLVTPCSGYEVWVGKGQVVKALFPPSSAPDPGKINRKNALQTMREIIDPQIRAYRQKIKTANTIKSSETGEIIYGEYHVDHVYPFIRLAQEWCRENKIDLETLPLKCRGIKCRFESVELSESWFDYHAFHAEFQVLDARENKIKGSKYFGRGK